MRNDTKGRPSGRRPMVDKRREFARLIGQGVSISEACRRLEIDRKTGHWWKNGGLITRRGVSRVVEPTLNRLPEPVVSARYLSEDERIVIADGLRARRSARQIAAQLGRSPSPVAREIARNGAAYLLDGGLGSRVEELDQMLGVCFPGCIGRRRTHIRGSRRPTPPRSDASPPGWSLS